MQAPSPPRKSSEGFLALVGGAVVLLVLVSLVLLLSDRRVLVYERKVDPGQSYFAGEWGELGKGTNSQLVCRYFTGRSITMTVYWYSPNNIMGRDQCPFVAKGAE